MRGVGAIVAQVRVISGLGNLRLNAIADMMTPDEIVRQKENTGNRIDDRHVDRVRITPSAERKERGSRT
jgi:hypothetical protein